MHTAYSSNVVARFIFLCDLFLSQVGTDKTLLFLFLVSQLKFFMIISLTFTNVM